MITDEERKEIVAEAVEKALLALPEVIGNLIIQQMSYVKNSRQFYKDHPEFAKRKDLVAAIMEKVEGEFPGIKYEEILEKAVPLIRKQMSITTALDTSTVFKPNRNLSDMGEL